MDGRVAASQIASTSCFNLSGLVGGLLFCPQFAWIFAVIDQRFQPGGFGACPSQIPSSDTPDGKANRFAEQARLKYVGSCTRGRDAKPEAGCFRIPVDRLLLAELALESLDSSDREVLLGHLPSM